MSKIYVIVDCCSGEDYSPDDPTVLFVSESYDKAKRFLEDEISNWQDGLSENYDEDLCCLGNCALDGYAYECTDFDYDSHRIIKMIPKEIQ